uniref:Uncharacterized protein n=1 Tax=Streptomyces sp. W75 TaxID=1170711 RepID=I0CEE5_9ACTN|nr:hypothetical protein pCQ4.33 [Streptomyces sp. W75]
MLPPWSWAVWCGCPDRPGRRKGARMPSASYWGVVAEGKADAAAMHSEPERQTDAMGEGLAAVAYALLDVAAAIRESTEARQQ